LVHAQTLEWVRPFGTAEDEWSNGVSADGLGNIYTASYRYTDQPGSCPYPYTCFDQNAAVSKFDAAGNLLWTQQFGSSADDRAWAVSADGLGNVFLAGDTGGNAFLAKFDPAGNHAWTRQLATPKADYGRGVSADGLGNVYISGRTEGTLAGNVAYGTFLSKYDADGNQQWIRQLSGTTEYYYSGGVSADELGNVFLSGNRFVAGFDASGELQWTQQIPAGNGRGVSADGLGNAYVAAYQGGTEYLSKFAQDGSLEWARWLGSPVENVYGVSADGLGHIYTTGYDRQTGSSETFLHKYDEFGNFYGTSYLVGDEKLYAHGVSADGFGNIYVSGSRYVKYHDDEFVAKFVEDPTQQPPVVIDRVAAAYQGELVVLPFLTPQGAPPITYHDLTMFGPYDVSPVNAPTLSIAGELLWQTTTSDVLGWYYFDVTATNEFGSDKGRIILRLQIPEPATIAMLGLAILAVGGFTRRRNSGSVTNGAPASRKSAGSIACRRLAVASLACVISQCVAVLTVLVISPCAQAAIIRQSALLGSTGRTVPVLTIGEEQYLGWRFSVANDVNVESVGGHLRGIPIGSDTFFGAIVSLSGPTALPSGNPFDMTTVATTVFTPPFPSDDVLVPLSVTLQPGDYALIFGSGQFGAGGGGGMPFNNVAIPGHASFIIWGSSEPQWRELSAQVYPLRFVLAGEVLPEPGTLLLAAGACAGILCVGLRRRTLRRTAILAVPFWVGTAV
jgi:hypothetical protein